MANHKSAAKRARQNNKKKERNLAIKSAVRTSEKSLRAAIVKKDKDASETGLLTFSKRIGKAAQKGVYNQKTASRKIGRLAKAIHALNHV